MFGVHKRLRSITVITAVASATFVIDNNQLAAVDKVPTKATLNNKSNAFAKFYYNIAIPIAIEFDQFNIPSRQLRHLILSVRRISEAEAAAGSDDSNISTSEHQNLSEPDERLDSTNEDKEKESLEEDDEKVWKEKAENCGFCRYFLTSPCAEPFKAWSLCVDKAKAENADFVSLCADRTAALMECTSSHSEYFNRPGSSEDSESESDDGAEEEAVEESSSENSSDATSETEKIEQDSDIKKE